MGSQVGLESIPAAFGQQARYTLEGEEEDEECFDWPSFPRHSGCWTKSSCWRYVQIYMNIESFKERLAAPDMLSVDFVDLVPCFVCPTWREPTQTQGDPADPGPSCCEVRVADHTSLRTHVWSKHFPCELVWKDCFLMISRHRRAELIGHGKWSQKDCSVGKEILTFMIWVERMGLAQAFVSPTPKVTENHQIRPQNMERVRMPKNSILFRLDSHNHLWWHCRSTSGHVWHNALIQPEIST